MRHWFNHERLRCCSKSSFKIRFCCCWKVIVFQSRLTSLQTSIHTWNPTPEYELEILSLVDKKVSPKVWLSVAVLFLITRLDLRHVSWGELVSSVVFFKVNSEVIWNNKLGECCQSQSVMMKLSACMLNLSTHFFMECKIGHQVQQMLMCYSRINWFTLLISDCLVPSQILQCKQEVDDVSVCCLDTCFLLAVIQTKQWGFVLLPSDSSVKQVLLFLCPLQTEPEDGNRIILSPCTTCLWLTCWQAVACRNIQKTQSADPSFISVTILCEFVFMSHPSHVVRGHVIHCT